MSSKSVTPSIRMSDEEYQKLKALKEKNNVSWDKFIAYVNRVISGDMEESNNDR